MIKFSGSLAKRLSIRQSFTEIALALELPGAHPQRHDNNVVLVQNGFKTSGKY